VPDATLTGTSDWLRARCDDIWPTLIEHPFVTELAAGTLPLAKFRFYVEQDVLFLDDYARSIGFAVARAADEDELRELTRQLATVVDDELEQERALLRRVEGILGGEQRGPASRAPTTAAYAGFLLATGARGDALDVMTALLPCAWSYADIGRAHLAATVEHPVYSDWMRLFGGAEYLGYVERRCAAYDRFAERAGPGRRERLLELFRTATRLERAFWDMAYEEEERR
jgi:thiaminase (transcriptional activator TenA)